MSGRTSTFKGVRLGVLERTLLVYAPPPGTHGGLVIDAPEGTSSVQKGYLRAAKKLECLDLLRRVRLRASARARDPRRERPTDPLDRGEAGTCQTLRDHPPL